MGTCLLAITSERLSLDNFSTQFISELIWFGKSLTIISFEVIWGQLSTRGIFGSRHYFWAQQAKTLHSRAVGCACLSLSQSCLFQDRCHFLFLWTACQEARFSLGALLTRWMIIQLKIPACRCQGYCTIWEYLPGNYEKLKLWQDACVRSF